MTRPLFRALPTDVARAYQSGGPDAYGRAPERKTADPTSSAPCRHCLTLVHPGEGYLVLAHRPFSAAQPYAETGPIFLHERACDRHPDCGDPPRLLLRARQLIARAYSADERIIYGIGGVIAPDRLAETAADLLERPEAAFVHVRFAATNCFACRIDRF
jgi:Protein of unknown function (DUF1203)